MAIQHEARSEPVEPVKYRVPRSCRLTAPAEEGGRAAIVRPAAPQTDGGRPSGRRLVSARPLPSYVEQALCDVVANPDSGITRVLVCGAAPESITHLERIAARRGLQATSAISPSLRRGWVRIVREERGAFPQASIAAVPVPPAAPRGPRAARGGGTGWLRRVTDWLWGPHR